MVQIREAKPEDLVQILALYMMLNGDETPDNNEDCRKMWQEMLDDENCHIIIAEDNGIIVSSCTCLIIRNITHKLRPFALVENVVTDSSHRSKGLATACLDEARAIARKADCYKIMLTTSSKLESTMRFYEKAGYNRVDKTAFVQWL